MALSDIEMYEGTYEMELEIPAFGSGFTINDIETCSYCSSNASMELEIGAGTPGAISDIEVGDTAHNNYMMLTFNYAWPNEDDVDNGVGYGVTPSEHTGNLVQPVVTDVKKDVQYGAHGTEFTGTYDPGGTPTPPPNPRPKFGGGLG